MKYTHIYALFLMSVFHTSCGQKQTKPDKDNINYNIKDTVTSYGPINMVRNVKQDRNGNILIAASWGGVFRYDGKSFTNIASKEDKTGNLGWVGEEQVSTFSMEKRILIIRNINTGL